MTTKNICLWGDSITYGAWDSAGGWADRLRIYLHDRTTTSRFEEYFWVYNFGIPGDTTADLLPRFDAECAARKPDVALFAIGINDSCRRKAGGPPRVDIATYKENLRTLAKKARGQAKQLVFVGLVSVDESATQPFNGEDAYFSHNDMLAYNEVITEVADEVGALYVDMLNLLAPEDLFDGLHPNAEGHEKMYIQIRDFLIVHGVIS
jgi:lysophospholipase L1-like esterase